MFQSAHHSRLALRIGLGITFLWLGIDALIYSQHWVEVWFSPHIQGLLQHSYIGPQDIINLMGIFEVFAGLALCAGFFTRFFAGAAVVLLVAAFLLYGFRAALAGNLGLIGGCAALLLWPDREYI